MSRSPRVTGTPQRALGPYAHDPKPLDSANQPRAQYTTEQRIGDAVASNLGETCRGDTSQRE